MNLIDSYLGPLRNLPTTRRLNVFRMNLIDSYIASKVFIQWMKSFHTMDEKKSFQPMDEKFSYNGWKLFIHCMKSFHTLYEKFSSSDLLVWGNGQFNFQVKLHSKALEGYYQKS